MSTRFIVNMIQRSAGLMLVLIGSSYILQPQHAAAPLWVTVTGIEHASTFYALFLVITGGFAFIADVSSRREAMLIASPIWIHTMTIAYYIALGGQVVSFAIYLFINVMMMIFIRYHFQHALVIHEGMIQRASYVIELSLDVAILRLRRQLIREIDRDG